MLFISSVLFFLQGLSGEVLTLLLSGICFVAIGVFFAFFGKQGLVAYILLGTLVSNIQVLKMAVLQTTLQPMVLGTVVFTSLFWAMDVITEHYGVIAARRILYLSLSAPFLTLLWMVLTIAYDPLETPDNLLVQQALETLFLPAPALFCASLIAYFVSQWTDIWIFAALKRATQGRLLGMRAILSTLVSGFLDNAVFSILAWKVFGIQDVDFSRLFWTYIIGAYGIRVLLSFGAAPLLHLLRGCIMKGWIRVKENKEWDL